MIDESRARELIAALTGDGTGLDGQGNCQLVSEAGRVISLHYSPQAGILALGALGQLPGDSELALRILKAFMGGNFLWQDSEGETFTYDDESNCIMMQRAIEEADGESLAATLESFDQDLGHFSAVLARLPEEFEDYDNS
ncbi:MAG: type III secretion system chaperone [Succinivibrionaceae bacterium]|nr:type III secretion system chaperone [Succinivibrionaceae bacterium]